MPLTTQLAPFSKVLAFVGPSLVATAILYSSVRGHYKKYVPFTTFSTEWANATIDSFSHKVDLFECFIRHIYPRLLFIHSFHSIVISILYLQSRQGSSSPAVMNPFHRKS